MGDHNLRDSSSPIFKNQFLNFFSYGNSYWKKCLCQAAFAVKRQKGSPLAERYYQIQSRRGSQKATIALAHQLLKIAYILLKEQMTYPEFLAQKKTTRDELVA
ncbi:hypothetical protein LI88_06440 [Streptococcus suis]|nr:hypothetical protein LI88_06440 [Streptococcus suis]